MPWERALTFTPGPKSRLIKGLVTTLQSVSQEVRQEVSEEVGLEAARVLRRMRHRILCRMLHGIRKLIRTTPSRGIRAGP